MSTRNLVNSNLWQLVSVDLNNLPLKVYNQFIPLPTNTQIGGVRPDGTTITIDGNGVISAVQGGSGSQFQFIPYISFNSGPSGGEGLTFFDPNFSYYQDNATWMNVLVNGVEYTPGIDFSLLDTVLTFNTYLSANSTIEVQAKAVPATFSVVSDITTQDGNLLTTQSGDYLIIN